MEKEIQRFKEQSNGVFYSNKDLIGGLHVKLDEINKKLEKGAIRFTKIETNLKWHNRLIIALYTIVGAFLIKPVRSIFNKIGGLL